MSGKTVAAVGTGVAAVLAAPAVLAGAGFTAAGVAAGSIAALLQVTSANQEEGDADPPGKIHIVKLLNMDLGPPSP